MCSYTFESALGSRLAITYVWRRDGGVRLRARIRGVGRLGVDARSIRRVVRASRVMGSITTRTGTSAFHRGVLAMALALPVFARRAGLSWTATLAAGAALVALNLAWFVAAAS